MKRWICLLFSAIFLLGMLSGCGAEKATAPEKMTIDGSYVIVCSEDASARQAALMQNILPERLGCYMEQYPTVFVGDFNSTPDSPV